jgi:hypothetical protein
MEAELNITIAQIEEQLRRLPMSKLRMVFDFVSEMVAREKSSDALQTMLASESILRRDWEQPEEEEAWANL